MQNQLIEAIKGVLSSLGIGEVVFSVEHPGDLSHGDYATNVALVAAKHLKKNPKVFAEEIVLKLKELNIKEVKEISIAGPGFINFTLAPEFFGKEIEKVLLEKENYGKGTTEEGKKVIVEYTDPNPFKELHIGHVMSNVIGESIARLIAFAGAEVKRASYHGDVGLHVAKALWAYQKKADNDMTYLVSGKAYADGNRAYEEDPLAKEEITKVNKCIYERTDKVINDSYDVGRKASFDSFYSYLEKMGTVFDLKFYESEAGPIGKKLVEQNIGNVFEQSDGAVVFPEEKSGIHTRVFLNSHGLPTYEAKELGLAKLKAERYPFDKAIVITGNEINDYFRVLLRAMSFLMPEIAAKTFHISHGMLRLPTGKMSSRTGTVITAEELFGKIEEGIGERIKERNFSDTEKADVSWKIAVAAVKYSILRQASGADVIYDFDKSISLEGDSGPYLQYAAVRASAVLKKGEEVGLHVDSKRPEEEDLSVVERLIPRFPEVAKRAAEELAPHYVATYLIELAGAFNNYYANTSIVEEGNRVAPYRLALSKSVSTVLVNGLSLLGIKTPERM